MKHLLIITLILIATIVTVVRIKKRKKEVVTKVSPIVEKPVEPEKPVIKVDTAPFAKDVVYFTDKQGVIEINKTTLNYGDIDGDIVTKVRFTESSQPLFKNKNLRTKYKIGEELDIENFSLYTKIKGKEDLTIKYQVFANNKWSK